MSQVTADRPWLASYDEGVPADIDMDGMKPITYSLTEAMDKYAERKAITVAGISKTYAEVAMMARDYGAYLTEKAGMQKGDRIAIMLPNLLAFPVAMTAHLQAAMVQVNVNPLYTPRELKHQLNDAGAKTIVIFEASLPTLLEILADTPIRSVIVVAAGSLLGGPTANLPEIDGVSVISIEEAIKQGEELDFEIADAELSDLAFLQYTGGTTGLSKGAMLSQGNISANIAQMLAHFGDNLTDDGEVVITALPLYHIFALQVNGLCQMLLGSELVLIPNPTDMPGFVKTLQNTPFTFITGVNTLYNGLIHTPGINDVDFSHVKFSMGGGAPVQKAVSEKWKELTGRHIVEGYGLSETSPVLTTNPLSQMEFRSSIGVPVPGTIISIRDDDGNPVPKGEPGEVCAAGPQIMQGYWNQPEKTAEVMTADGFFRTGDVGVEDDGGFFRIVDRKKDMILVSGFNVFPNEIEDTVAHLDGIVECACIGVPDEKSGEAVRLFVVKQPEADITEDSVRAFCKTELTGYKVPKRVIFLDELPKSTVGKILRRELRNPEFNQ